MRRFITLMVSAMLLIAIGFSSSTAKADPSGKPADLYLYGKINGTNSTNPGNLTTDVVKMNKISDTEWEIKLTNTAEAGYTFFKILAIYPNDGSWYAYSAEKEGENGDLEIVESSTDLGCWYKGTNKEAGVSWYCNNLAGKYVYIRYDASSYPNVFKVSVRNTSSLSVSDPEKIWIFGNVGNTSDWNTHETDYVLTKTGTEGDKSVYTGKVTFRKGENWFRFWDGSTQSGPNGTSADQPINLNEAFTTSVNVDKAFKYNNTTGVDKEYDVKLVYNGKQNYTVTITAEPLPATLYIYSTSDYNTPFATLAGNGNGVYTATLGTDSGLQTNVSYYIFVSSLDAGTGRTGWESHNGKRFTTGRDEDRTIITSGSMDLTLTDTGTVEYKTESAGTATFTFTLNNDARSGKLEVAFDEYKDYYLSGDINDWATKDNNAALLETYKFTPVMNSEVNNEPGWYVLNVPSMHGQFKIHSGNWANGYENWGCIWTNNDTFGDLSGDALYTYIDESKVAESMPADANLGYQSKTENKGFYNLRCSHNYYNDASIYFNPTANKLFIDGTPEDLYVYYYNGDDENEKAGRADIYIKENAVNVNTHHYYYDDRKLSEKMSFVALTAEERQIPALANVPDGASCYKGIVPPGLEEEYMADGSAHYFEFYLEGASKVGEEDKDVFSGQNVYYIFAGTLPAVVFHYKDMDGTEVFGPETDNVEEICYRLIAIDANGVPQYIKDDGSRTVKRSEAAKYVLDYKLTNGEDGFNPGSGSVWHGVTKKSAVASVVANDAAAWTTHVEQVKAGDVNRYVEIDVKLKDPDKGSTGTYHEFHSDFVLGDDTNVQDGDIDSKALMTGKLLSGRSATPQYKLNGTDLYAEAQTSVPTAVEEIPVDNGYDNDAEAVYYNLQGVRVTNPDRGIYIMVKGRTAQKVRL